ncbi:MAG: hypothetical protein R3B49_09445 [Phycisphaerales bacterium]
MTRLDPDTPVLRIGPGSDPSDPAALMARARAEARRQDEERYGRAIAKRLFIAFLACLLIALACFVLVPAWVGVHVPPYVPLLSFLAIAAGAIMTMPDRPDADACACEDEGRPVGCCSGPRPLRAFRDDR